MTLPRGGLYAITDTSLLGDDEVISTTESLLQAGIHLLQYRDKQRHDDDRRELGERLVALADPYRVPVIVNDDPSLAIAIGAAGVHLGREDAGLSSTRERYPDLIIGVSCYNDLERAVDARDRGADYLAFGAFYPSTSKPGAVHADVNLLVRARTVLDRPIVAIGGITPENGAPLLAAGADFLAVISGLYANANPYENAKNYLKLFADT
jgi:thiamine-phosphate pyrophosphorylase